MTSFNESVLNAHNKLRAKHGAPPLTLSKDLCKISQAFAEKLAKQNKMEHSNNKDYGENVYMMNSSDPVPDEELAKDACNSWYSEIKYFKFGEEKVEMKALHFSQLIWKGTTELGVGKGVSKDGSYYVVCNYGPRGNFKGEFVKNCPAKVK